MIPTSCIDDWCQAQIAQIVPGTKRRDCTRNKTIRLCQAQYWDLFLAPEPVPGTTLSVPGTIKRICTWYK
jgi:hypothetical protein